MGCELWVVGEELWELETENSIFETENSILETENSILETENSILETQNSILETENSILKTENFLFMQDFHGLQIWKRGHELTLKVYDASKLFPKEELFGLSSQVRRAAYSIPTNIAEGCGRKTNADFSHFLQMSIGSASELEYEILLAKDLHYIPDDIYNQLISEIVELRKMIIKFQKKLE